jgi:nucleotide-binding universal stress UspA family protein
VADGVAHRVRSNTIVVAVDGSAASDAALDWAIREARASNRELLLVYVLTVSDELATSLLPMFGGPDMSTVGREILQRSSSKCQQSGVTHSEALVEGSATESLSRISSGAAMLVMGGHEHHRSPPPPPESVLEGCLHRCQSPLVVVKAAQKT